MAYNRHLGQGGFRGVDFSSHPSLVSPDRFSNALNVWRDYHSGQGSAAETFPGYRQITEGSLGGEIFGIFRYRIAGKDYLIVHAGKKLYVKSVESVDEYPISEISGADMAEKKSSGFQYATCFYVCDGEHYYKISPDASGNLTANAATDEAYVPTTYVNGVEYEQRNMLTDVFKQHWTSMHGLGNDAETSSGLSFRILSTEDKTCEVRGEKFVKGMEALVVPSSTVIGGETYRVVSIAEYAFDFSQILSVKINEGVETIKKCAFYRCGNIENVLLPQSLKIIEERAFSGNSYMKSITIGAGVENIAEDAFEFCGQGKGDANFGTDIYYQGTQEQWNALSADFPSSTEHTVTCTTYEDLTACSFSLAVYEPCKTVENELTLTVNEIPVTTEKYVATKDEKVIEGKVYFEKRTYDTGRTVYFKSYMAVDQPAKGLYERATMTFSANYDKDGYISEILLYFWDHDTYLESLDGVVELSGTAESGKFTVTGNTAFVNAEPEYDGTVQDAILGCTITAQYDGRIFFTGNPALPNTVFYSHRDLTGHNNPCYFGTYNFFDVGIGSSPNVAMISTGSNLIVLKNDTVQDGSINCYQGVDGSDDILPRIYVRTQGLPGIGCLGAACNFADDPVFVTTRGLDAVGTQTVNLERTVQHRSSNVDRRLLAEDLSKATLTEWDGYLVLLTPNGHVYLADSRQVFTHSTGVTQYEWYYLDDIGHYEGDESVYRYSDFRTHKTLLAKEDAQAVLTAGENEVKSFDEEDGSTYYYVEENDVRYAVVPTAERTGGIFSPAVIAAGIGDLLFFGTADGHLLLVNTDKRGTLPTGALSAEIEAEEEYLSKYRESIPREWYSHAGHAYPSLVELAFENAGIPHMTKNTVRKTSVVKLKSLLGSQCKFNVRTNRENAYDQEEKVVTTMPDFGDNDLGATSFLTGDNGMIFNILEKKKKWVEKQYAFYSDEWCRPWGIYHVSYSYEIEGRVKNR